MSAPDYPLESLKLLKDWSIWMVTVQTALLGFMGTMAKEFGVKSPRLFETTVYLFALSILFAAWVLSGIPSVARRIPQGLNFSEYKI